ncbi:hypothetical protein B566_EDAN009608 [Ephemera danica]|nr:hypothetical protein B566_EDAN009608 [Ephemera danica]
MMLVRVLMLVAVLQLKPVDAAQYCLEMNMLLVAIEDLDEALQIVNYIYTVLWRYFKNEVDVGVAVVVPELGVVEEHAGLVGVSGLSGLASVPVVHSDELSRAHPHPSIDHALAAQPLVTAKISSVVSREAKVMPMSLHCVMDSEMLPCLKIFHT